MHSSQDYFLRTARLGFRTWSTEDLPLALALWGDSRVTRLIGGPFSPAKVAEKLRQEATWQEQYGIQYWPIFLLETGAHAGCAGLRPYRPNPETPELGFHLRRESWGMGLAEEASRGVIAYAFTELHAAGVVAGHHQENVASKHILEKLGFQFTREELYPPTGLMHPLYLLERPREK